jgi:hypothetical protein
MRDSKIFADELLFFSRWHFEDVLSDLEPAVDVRIRAASRSLFRPKLDRAVIDEIAWPAIKARRNTARSEALRPSAQDGANHPGDIQESPAEDEGAIGKFAPAPLAFTPCFLPVTLSC